MKQPSPPNAANAETGAGVGNADAGAAIYNRQTLAGYDFVVLTVSNRLAWKCPTAQILDFYNQHITANHLDVGVGTGYFLDKCRFPSATPNIHLLDLNPYSLKATADRLRRYQPTVKRANVLEPIKLNAKFDSIALNYLLHCLPGSMRSKGVVFDHLKPFLNEGGVIFGTTILGADSHDIQANALARSLMRLYNSRGVFGNAQDNLADLESKLKTNFRDVSTKVVGCVAFFSGRV
jgi:hypothetical protein